MSTQQITVCDYCGEIIKPREGFTVQGNIYLVGGGGLVGNNIKSVGVDEDMKIFSIESSDYHLECLHEVLNYDQST